jgi:hypothetical protein
VPQFFGSAFVSTHFESQRSGVGIAQLDEHLATPPIVVQSPRGGVQVIVQLPQLEGRVKSVSQPSFGSMVQCPKPLTHADG